MDSLELFGEILEPQNNWENNWDEECDREVAAVTWKVETEPLVKKSSQKSKLKSLSKKISASAPQLEFLTTEPKEPPLLFSCSRCLFMCSDKNFLVAHSIIEHEESCTEFSKGDEKEVFVERSEAAKKIIAVVKHVIMESITRARCDTEIILEEANEAQLVSMNDIARSIVDSTVTVEPEACSDEHSADNVFNSSLGSERDLEEMLPSQAKRRKKAQPRKLQIENEDLNDTLNKSQFAQASDVVTLVEARDPESDEEKTPSNTTSFLDSFTGLSKPLCPLCHQEFDSQMHLSTHLEDIHMSWISPQMTLYTDSSNSIPIVPFSSITAGSTQHSQGAMEPWRLRHGRSCNKNSSKKTKNWRNIKCNLCIKKPKMSLSEFKTHMTNTHHYRRAYCCHQCSTSFKSLEAFVEHNRIHEQRPFSCDVCDLTFKTKREQNEHRRSESHQKAILEQGQPENVDIVYEETSPIKCPSCDFRCHEMSLLAKHLREESHFHPCEYQGCNGFFRSKENLTNHIATAHEGHGAFLCDLCGKSFRLHATLLRHKGRNHNQKNMKKCSFCPAQFADNYKLTRHIRSIHSKEKPFKCDFPGCDKAFARKDKLQDHKWSHSKSKMFICHVCDRAYLRPDCLKAHEKIHLATFKHLTCHLCDARFQTKELYSRHLKSVHDVDIEDNVKRKRTKRKSQNEKKAPVIVSNEKSIASDILVSAIASQLSIPEVFPPRIPNFESEIPVPNSQYTLTVNKARLTDLQPVEVLVGGSGAVQSIHPVNLKFPKLDSISHPSISHPSGEANNSNSCSPTILQPVQRLQPVENADAPQFSHFSLADDNWTHTDPSIFLNSRPSMVSVDSKFIDPSRSNNFLASPKSE